MPPPSQRLPRRLPLQQPWLQRLSMPTAPARDFGAGRPRRGVALFPWRVCPPRSRSPLACPLRQAYAQERCCGALLGCEVREIHCPRLPGQAEPPEPPRPSRPKTHPEPPLPPFFSSPHEPYRRPRGTFAFSCLSHDPSRAGGGDERNARLERQNQNHGGFDKDQLSFVLFIVCKTRICCSFSSNCSIQLYSLSWSTS